MNAPPLRVVHSVSEWLPQTLTWLYNQVRYLPPEAVESHVFCETSANLDQFPIPHLHCLRDDAPLRLVLDRGLRRLRLRRHLGSLPRVAREVRASILHSHFGNVGWANVPAARGARTRHVVTFYGYDLNYLPGQDRRWYGRYRELFGGVDRVLCEGPHMAKCVRELGCPPERVTVHHLGVAVDRIPFRPRIPERGEPLRILLAGSFREKKGFPDAVEAAGILSREHPVEITILGDAPPEPRGVREKQAIQDALDRHRLRDRTRMLGYRPHRVFFEEARRAHVFLAPSVHAADGDTEGGAPVAIIEMAAAGLPVVSTTHCDIPEVIVHGETGWLAGEREPEALAEGLRDLVARPEVWRKRVEAGRRRIETRFDCVTQGQRLAELYGEIAGGSGTGANPVSSR